MTDDFERDAALCARIVTDGLKEGDPAFLRRHRIPYANRDTPAYGHFAALGFCPVYQRTNYERTIQR